MGCLWCTPWNGSGDIGRGGLVVRRLVRAKGGGWGDERGEMRGGRREWRGEGGERRGERERERLLLLYIHCLQCVCLVAIHHT